VSWWPAFVRDVRRERTYTTDQVGWIGSAYNVLPPTAAAAELPRPGTEPSTT